MAVPTGTLHLAAAIDGDGQFQAPYHVELARLAEGGVLPEAVAAEMAGFVAADAADGLILVPHLTPGGLDDFVARVVPPLPERGVFRTAYTGPTLRDHLGLPRPGERG